MTKPGLLTLTIKDKSALYLAYMPQVINGGLFIPTNSSYRLGDEVFMLLNLMGEDVKIVTFRALLQNDVTRLVVDLLHAHEDRLNIGGRNFVECFGL